MDHSVVCLDPWVALHQHHKAMAALLRQAWGVRWPKKSTKADRLNLGACRVFNVGVRRSHQNVIA